MPLERIHWGTMLLAMQVTVGVPQKVLIVKVIATFFFNGENIHTLTEFLELCLNILNVKHLGHFKPVSSKCLGS